MKNVAFVFVSVSLFLWPLFASANPAASPFLVLQEDTAPPETTTPPPPAASSADKKPDEPEEYDVSYSYDPAGRRDPFLDLLATGNKNSKNVPKGALTVDDAKVVGITRNKSGFTAIIVGNDNKARFMKAGDKLYDGEILSIESDKVVFRQDLKEDNATVPGLRSKEVVKRLYPVQEGT